MGRSLDVGRECVKCEERGDSPPGALLLLGYTVARLVGVRVAVDWVTVVFQRELRLGVVVIVC